MKDKKNGCLAVLPGAKQDQSAQIGLNNGLYECQLAAVAVTVTAAKRRR